MFQNLMTKEKEPKKIEILEIASINKSNKSEWNYWLEPNFFISKLSKSVYVKTKDHMDKNSTNVHPMLQVAQQQIQNSSN